MRLLTSICAAIILSALYIIPSAIAESDAADVLLEKVLRDFMSESKAKEDAIRRQTDALRSDPKELATYKEIAKKTGLDPLKITDDSLKNSGNSLRFELENNKITPSTASKSLSDRITSGVILAGGLSYISLVFASLTVSLFFCTSIIRTFILESHIGWRRLVIVSSLVASLLAPIIYALDIGNAFPNVFFVSIAALFATAASILYGRKIYHWVIVGFTK